MKKTNRGVKKENKIKKIAKRIAWAWLVWSVIATAIIGIGIIRALI